MWRGQGRSFDRSADAASGGYEHWSQQTRGDPSAPLSIFVPRAARLRKVVLRPQPRSPAPRADPGGQFVYK